MVHALQIIKVSACWPHLGSQPDEADTLFPLDSNNVSASTDAETVEDEDSIGNTKVSWNPLSTSDYLQHIKYSAVASFLRQSDSSK